MGIHGDAKVIRRSFGLQLKGYLDVRCLGVLLRGKGILIPKTSFGLKALATYLFGIDIPTGSTRSNWEQRPLSDDQLIYGAMDAYFSRMTALIMLHCYKTGRMVNYGTDDFLFILRSTDETLEQTLEAFFQRYKSLVDSPFRQPAWLKHNQKARKDKDAAVQDMDPVSVNAKLEEKWLGLHVAKCLRT